MNKRGTRYLILSVIFLIFCINFVLAGVSIKNNSVATQYALNGKITGSINLSFTNISSDAYLTTSFGKNISLIDLIKKQSNFSYSCSTFNCSSSYSTTDSGNNLKEFSLIEGQSQAVGFIIEGDSPAVQQGSFSLGVTSTATESNVPQLTLDLLNDNSLEWSPYIASGNFGSEYSGCYTTTSHQSQGNPTSFIGSTQYCEKIPFFTSPQVSIGAYLTGSGVSTMQMSIQDVKQTSVSGICTEVTSATGTTEVSCVPKKADGTNYSIKKDGDFYVCIRQTSGSSNSYTINRENSAPCGFVGIYSQSTGYTIDYDLFGKSGRFAALQGFTINDALVTSAGYSKNLESEITSYLSSKYGDDCSNKCVVPMIFNAQKNQDINLNNFHLFVEDPSYGTTELNLLYDIKEANALINTTGYRSLSLDAANFSVPNSFGEHNFELKLIDGSNSYVLLSKNINVERIPRVDSVFPRTTAGALPTEFTANVNKFGSNSSIVQYKWDFGDGSPIQTTTTKTVSHTYNQLGIFNLQVSISNSQGLSSSAGFEISVVSPKDAITKRLSENQINLAAIKSKLGNYPVFAQNTIKQTLNLNFAETKLQELQLLNNNATTDEQYLNIMRELIQINLPESIDETTSAISAPFFPTQSNINLELLKNIGGGDYDSQRSSEYIDAIVLWGLDNVQATIDYSEFSVVYGDSWMPLISTIKVNVQGIATGSAYLVIPALDNIQFDKNYSQSGDYYYVPLSSSPQTIQFATSESLSPVNLPIFISPSLSELSITNVQSSSNKMIIFAIVMASAIILGLTVYILVGKWYQRKYEAYLFKDRNDLYNMINYVHRLKSRGAKEGEIEKNLRKAKWNPEQVSYVIRRYAGKGVGIFGFKKNYSSPSSESSGQKNINLKSNIKRRNPVAVLILSIITLGIYGIYWVVSTTNELRKNTKSAPNPNMLWLFLIPVVNIIIFFFYYWKYSQAIEELTGFTGVGLFLLWIFFSPIAIIISQVQLNKISRRLK